MSTMARESHSHDIDIESLQHEILAAETYLRHNSIESSGGGGGGGGGGDQLRSSLTRIDDLRKSDILQQMGRKPLGSAGVAASTEQPLYPQHQRGSAIFFDGDNDDSAAPSPDSVDMGQRAARVRQSREGGLRSEGIVDASSRYSDPAQREQLISRLLESHRSKHSGSSVDSSSYHSNDGMGIDGSLGDDVDEYKYDDDASERERRGDDDEIFFASDLASPRQTHHLNSYPLDEAGAALERAEQLENMLTIKVRQAWGEPPLKKNLPGASSSGNGGTAAKGKSVSISLAANTRRQTERGRSTSSGRSGGSGDSDRGRYRDARDDEGADVRQHRDESSGNKYRYLKSKDDLQQEAETDFQREFKFTPALSKRVQRYSSAQEALQSTRSGPARPQSLAARIEEINLKHQRALEDRERVRRETERQELADCTFQPAICKTTRAIVAKMGRMGRDQMAVVESNAPPAAVAAQRLHQEAATRAEQQRSLQHRVQEARQQDYTFQPEIATSASAAGRALETNIEHRPIFERAAEEQRYRTKRLADLRQSHEQHESEALTFNPQIDQRSRQMALAQGTEREQSAGNRLYQEQSKQQQRHQQRLMQHARIEAEHAKHPQLSRGSAKIAQSNPALQRPFETRQQHYQQAVKRRSDARRKQEEDAQEAWFRPEIGKSADIVASRRPELLAETEEERTRRLSLQDAADIASRRNDMEKEVYKDVTFRPALDPVSAALGKKSSLQDLVDNPRGRSVREKAKRQQDQVVEAECSFRPTVRDYRIDTTHESSYRYAVDHSIDGWASQTLLDATNKENSVVVQAKINIREPDKLARDIRLHLQEREERRRAELMARELETLRECTFAPTVQPAPADAGQPIVVRGLGRHLELKHLSIKQREEKVEREREVFSVKGVDRLRRQEDGGTILRPFSLSSPNPRPSSAVQALQAESEAECTFVPVTSHVLRRDVISRQARAVF